MSYYFAIVGTKDNPLFEHEFGTSKQGGDGIARFREEARHMNQFIVHSSLDIVEEVQWGSGQMYLKHIDRFYNNYISCFLTGGNIKFLLLHNPDPSAPNTHASLSSQPNPPSASTSRLSTASLGASSRTNNSSVASNPTSPAAEEAVRQFMVEIYDAWVKNLMNPFYGLNAPVKSPVFRARVAAAAKKYL
ncbi:trafficking protein-like protein particle complex subunit 2 [Viridothelium virens]|uniref:Trafficking protein-like protein particle complex subunit 2 n=1 Tax=Viridothelium virens TaxID=1048519 RepID=A0A6A6H2D7_VIRVR|nr:trafficking protein-like protein particle complex subunit 2 [Viridothelium virens]